MASGLLGGFPLVIWKVPAPLNPNWRSAMAREATGHFCLLEGLYAANALVAANFPPSEGSE